MRLMSFSMTTEAYRNREKTVTRRLGWWNLKVGDVLMGVEKAQGLKKGEHVKRMHRLRVSSALPEPLDRILYYPSDETAREGFSDLTPSEFVDMFCRANHCRPYTPVNRIEFEHECPDCRGKKGWFTWDNPVEDYTPITHFWRMCPTCDGDGWIAGRKAP